MSLPKVFKALLTRSWKGKAFGVGRQNAGELRIRHAKQRLSIVGGLGGHELSSRGQPVDDSVCFASIRCLDSYTRLLLALIKRTGRTHHVL